MLANVIYDPPHSSIYPGEYEPLPGREKELTTELISNPRVTRPPINVITLSDHYRIEMPAPGFRRDQFEIQADGQILSIAGMIRKSSAKEEKDLDFHGFHCECIQRNIVLPPDVDTEFVTAEYINGMLCICLFRTTYPVVNRPAHIIVY